MRKPIILPRGVLGFSLVEVTLALGIMAFSLVALFGLLPIGVNSNLASTEQTAAASAAASVLADLRATPLGAGEVRSPLFSIPVPTDVGLTAKTHTLFLREDGTLAIPVDRASTTGVDTDADPTQNPRYRVTLTFPPLQSTTSGSPPSSPSLAATQVRVLVTWPALNNPLSTKDPSLDAVPKFSGSFDVTSALDRH